MEKRGLAKEKRGRFGVKAALQMPLYGTPKKSVTPYKRPSTTTPQAPVAEQTQLHKLWQPRWPTLRKQSLTEATIIILTLS